jgi:uridine kinase
MGGFKRQAPFIIGVAGGTASGKTTVYASPLHLITLQPISERPIPDSDRDFIQFKKKKPILFAGAR